MRGRFLANAARVMRGLIIDYARNRCAQKRGGLFEITALTPEIADNVVDPSEMTAISDALDQLSKTDPALAEIVDLKFFCGFSFAEIADLLGISARTAQRHWEKAHSYLHRNIQPNRTL